MNDMQQYFYERKGCPFCETQSETILCDTFYHDTAEANKDLPNIEGRLYHCPPCGIAYASHGCHLEAFPQFYKKSLSNLSSLNNSLLQRFRKLYLRGILSSFYTPLSLSRFLNAFSLNIFQPPPVLRRPKDLNILDVGCGFGEFLSLYKRLGNSVVGTEVMPELVRYIRESGMECFEGSVENMPARQNKFDVIILRAVFYRTEDPRRTLEYLKGLLAPDGEIALVDPYPHLEGLDYFFKKQFPQGHFYITDSERYLLMIHARFGLAQQYKKQIYGRPISALKKIRTLENITGALELLYANIFRTRPYVLSYNLSTSNN